MSITDDRRTMVALWIVTALAALLFGGFIVFAIVEEPFAALFGLAGLLVGALIVGCITLTRRRSDPGAGRQERVLEAVAERLESLESERGRVLEGGGCTGLLSVVDLLKHLVRSDGKLDDPIDSVFSGFVLRARP